MQKSLRPQNGPVSRHQLSDPPACCELGLTPIQPAKQVTAAGPSPNIWVPVFVTFNAYSHPA